MWSRTCNEIHKITLEFIHFTKTAQWYCHVIEYNGPIRSMSTNVIHFPVNKVITQVEKSESEQLLTNPEKRTQKQQNDNLYSWAVAESREEGEAWWYFWCRNTVLWEEGSEFGKYCFLFSTYSTTLLTLLLSKLIVCWLRVWKFFFPPEQTILSSPCNLIEQLQYFLNQPEREYCKDNLLIVYPNQWNCSNSTLNLPVLSCLQTDKLNEGLVLSANILGWRTSYLEVKMLNDCRFYIHFTAQQELNSKFVGVYVCLYDFHPFGVPHDKPSFWPVGICFLISTGKSYDHWGGINGGAEAFDSNDYRPHDPPQAISFWSLQACLFCHQGATAKSQPQRCNNKKLCLSLCGVLIWQHKQIYLQIMHHTPVDHTASLIMLTGYRGWSCCRIQGHDVPGNQCETSRETEEEMLCTALSLCWYDTRTESMCTRICVLIQEYVHCGKYAA